MHQKSKFSLENTLKYTHTVQNFMMFLIKAKLFKCLFGSCFCSYQLMILINKKMLKNFPKNFFNENLGNSRLILLFYMNSNKILRLFHIKSQKYVLICLKFSIYALICIYSKNGQNMHLHMQVCKCITIRSLIMTLTRSYYSKN